MVNGERPRWVRVLLRDGTKRQMAATQVATFALIAAIGWVTASIESTSSSVLGVDRRVAWRDSGVTVYGVQVCGAGLLSVG